MLRSLLLSVALVLSVAACDTPGPGGPGGPPPTLPIGRLDLNRATVKQLEALPGIGSVRARSIIASRNARGGRFRNLEELLAIDGIGEQTVAQLRAYVEVR